MNNSEIPDDKLEPADHSLAHESDATEPQSAKFIEWRSSLPTFEMDGARYYLPTGDIPMDAAEVADYWRRLNTS